MRYELKLNLFKTVQFSILNKVVLFFFNIKVLIVLVSYQTVTLLLLVQHIIIRVNLNRYLNALCSPQPQPYIKRQQVLSGG